MTFGFIIAAAALPPAAFARPKSPPTTAPRSPTVRAVATHPAAYLGHLILSGVVGLVTPGKGFILVDTREYRQEGFVCLTTDEPTKIPIEWMGTAPRVKETVRVAGKLVKNKKGYAFIAGKVSEQ